VSLAQESFTSLSPDVYGNIVKICIPTYHDGKFMSVPNRGVITIDGFDLHYTIEGSGIPALVIGCALYYPRTFSRYIRTKLQMIFIDHRGFARSHSSFDANKFTLDTIVNDIETIRKHLGVERMVVIGHSAHGYMAQAYAKKYPQHVSHVVIIAMGPDQSAESHKAAQQYLDDSVCPERKAYLAKQLEDLDEKLAEDPEHRFITLCLKLGARSWFDYQFDASHLWKDVYVNMPVIDHFWGVVFRDIHITQDINKLTMPVLLALGRYDYLVAPPYTWNSIRALFPKLIMRVFGKSSHTPQYEQPADFDRELLEWLNIDLV